MRFMEFLNALKKRNLLAFTLEDAEALFPHANQKTIKNNLTRWTGKNYVTRLKRGLYECTQLSENIPDYYIANQLYQPSYVSMETALSFYGIIPEEAAEVTSTTTKPTRLFRNKHGVFTYRTCKKNAFFGYRIMKFAGWKTLIADREKALADFVYFRLLDGQKDFTEERLNLSKVNWKTAERYARAFNANTLKTVRSLKNAFKGIPA